MENGQAEWLSRHCHQKNDNSIRSDDLLQERLRDLFSDNGKGTVIKENLKRDQERGTYTFFDYMNAVSKLPNDVLLAVTNMAELERREFVRSVSIPQYRPVSRIWKKVTFA